MQCLYGWVIGKNRIWRIMQISLRYFKDGWPFQDKKESPPRQKHICSETFSLENASPVSNFKRSELNLPWIQMTYKNFQKELPKYILNVFILLTLLSVLTRSYIEEWRCFGKYSLTIISWHSYKHACFNLPRKAHYLLVMDPQSLTSPSFEVWLLEFFHVCLLSYNSKDHKDNILEWLEHCHSSDLHSIFYN